MAAPWYYTLFWKMQAWLNSRTDRSLDRDRGFFGRMLSESPEMRLRSQPVPVRGGAAFHLRHKPIEEKIRQGCF